jgi:hypothetical protein
MSARKVDINVNISIDASIEEVFEYIVPVDLSHIFHRYLMVPGVKRSDEAQRWITPGLSRTVYFEDGSTAREALLTVVPAESFTYRITDFTGIHKLLVWRVDGSWRFVDSGEGRTDIAWIYSLLPKSVAARVAVRLFVAPMLRVVLQRALAIIKTDLEADTHKQKEVYYAKNNS